MILSASRGLNCQRCGNVDEGTSRLTYKKQCWLFLDALGASRMHPKQDTKQAFLYLAFGAFLVPPRRPKGAQVGPQGGSRTASRHHFGQTRSRNGCPRAPQKIFRWTLPSEYLFRGALCPSPETWNLQFEAWNLNA